MSTPMAHSMTKRGGYVGKSIRNTEELKDYIMGKYRARVACKVYDKDDDGDEICIGEVWRGDEGWRWFYDAAWFNDSNNN